MRLIPFNKPYLTGKEMIFIEKVMNYGQLAGNGILTQECHAFFENRYAFEKCFLTNSATASLEMAAILAEIEPGDEVIVPSFTFVATATPFALRGAKLVFCDSSEHHPNMDETLLESLITSKTKAIVVMHYAGMACEMDTILEITRKHGLFLIEDAAHAIDSYYKGSPLGSFGQLAAFSFHETKNISSGQGGLLVVNDQRLVERAQIVWEKGTNREAFRMKTVDAYTWVDHGSNYYPSEITAAFLSAQLSEIEQIHQARRIRWERYFQALSFLSEKGFTLPSFQPFQTNNHHIFYIVCPSNSVRNEMINYLAERGISALFHYQPLHNSPFVRKHQPELRHLQNAELFAEQLIRLPLYIELSTEDQDKIISEIHSFANQL